MLQVNLEEEGFCRMDWTVTKSGIFNCKPGKLSDQSIQLLIGSWSGILLLLQGIHSSRGWLLEIDRLPITDLNCWYQGDILRVFHRGYRESRDCLNIESSFPMKVASN